MSPVRVRLFIRSRAADVREVLSRDAMRIRRILRIPTKLNLHGDYDAGDGLRWLDDIHYAGIDKFFVDKFTAPARAPGRLLFAAVHRRIHCVVIVLRVALDMRRYAGLFQQRPQRLLQLLDVIPHETLE